jgi:hypothetical protein
MEEMMDSQDILRELKKVLIRYRTGLISIEQCRQEVSILATMLKAYEDTVMEEKLDRIQMVIGDRR